MLGAKLGVFARNGVCGVGMRTIGYDARVVAFNGLVCDSLGEIDGQEDRVHLAADGIKGRFQQYCFASGFILDVVSKGDRLAASVVPATVGELLWVPDTISILRRAERYLQQTICALR